MIEVNTPAGTFTVRDEVLANEVLGAFGTTVAAAHAASTIPTDEIFAWDVDSLATTYEPVL